MLAKYEQVHSEPAADTGEMTDPDPYKVFQEFRQ